MSSRKKSLQEAFPVAGAGEGTRGQAKPPLAVPPPLPVKRKKSGWDEMKDRYLVVKQYSIEKLTRTPSSRTQNDEDGLAEMYLTRLHEIRRHFQKLQTQLRTVLRLQPSLQDHEEMNSSFDFSVIDDDGVDGSFDDENALLSARNPAQALIQGPIAEALQLEKSYKQCRLLKARHQANLESLEAKQQKKGPTPASVEKIRHAQSKLEETTRELQAQRAALFSVVLYLDGLKERVHRRTIRFACVLLQTQLPPLWLDEEEKEKERGQHREQEEEEEKLQTRLLTDAGDDPASPEMPPATESSSPTLETAPVDIEGLLAAIAEDGGGLQELIQDRPVYIAEYPLAGEGENEMPLDIGDRIRVLDDSTEGWWLGFNESNLSVGLFPINYTRPLVPE